MKCKNVYDYYESIRKKSTYIFNRYNLLLNIAHLNYDNYYYQKLINQEKFYNFLLNLFNREIFRT